MLDNSPILQTHKNFEENFIFVKSVPGLITVKDNQLNFSAITKEFSLVLGWKNIDEGLGKNEFYIPCGAAKIAEKFIEIDRRVINNVESLHTVDICETSFGKKVCLTKKVPIIDSHNNVTGVYGYTTDISQTSLAQWYLSFNFQNMKFNSHHNESHIYIIDQSNCPLDLTSQQQICLFLSIRGKSAKEIAKILHLSTRTVESYFEKIKHKLNCTNKSNLIEIAINNVNSGLEMRVYKGLEGILDSF